MITTRIECEVNGINNSSIKRIDDTWYLIRCNTKHFLVERNDIKSLEQTGYIGDYIVSANQLLINELEPLNICDILEFKFVLKNSNVIKFAMVNMNINIYIPVKYFKSKKIKPSQFNSKQNVDFIIGKRGLYYGVQKGLFISIPYRKYIKITPIS